MLWEFRGKSFAQPWGFGKDQPRKVLFLQQAKWGLGERPWAFRPPLDQIT